MQRTTPAGTAARARRGERGAALVTVMLMSTLLMAAGAAMLMTSMYSATGAIDATAESQAYYAAEAGLQATLAVLRGNAAPNPLFNVDPASDANKISFRKAVNVATSNAAGTSADVRLTRWLNYNNAYNPPRVPVSPNYNPATGMAFRVVEIVDPDNTDQISFSTREQANQTTLTCFQPGGPNTPNFTLVYTPQASTTLSTGGGTSASTLGTLQVTAVSQNNSTVTISPLTPYIFNLTIQQTSPWPSTTTIPVRVYGTVARVGNTITPALTFEFPQLSYSLGGVHYVVPASTVLVNNTAARALPVNVTAPEPNRLRIRVVGMARGGAEKRMQMLVSNFNFLYNAASAITIRSDDTDLPMNFNPGNSAQYGYDGNDNAGGPNLPAFTVTSDPDFALINAVPLGQVFGNPPVRKVAVSSLAPFLQTTTGQYGARATVDLLRAASKNQVWPNNCAGSPDACDRYFPSGTVPTDLGAGQPDGLFTFVDGDLDLPPGGGAGLLVVTGTLTMRGSAEFKGLILVLGAGQLLRDGGGNGNTLGSAVVARFDAASNFLAPTFNSNGSGNSGIRYDSDWVRRALKGPGPLVVGVTEY